MLYVGVAMSPPIQLSRTEAALAEAQDAAAGNDRRAAALALRATELSTRHAVSAFV